MAWGAPPTCPGNPGQCEAQGVYAFQEFCTRRFDPLSEGCFKNGQVECPWHRCCFDVPTGKVIHDPAKEELRAYPIEIREGEICVSVQ